MNEDNVEVVNSLNTKLVIDCFVTFVLFLINFSASYRSNSRVLLVGLLMFSVPCLINLGYIYNVNKKITYDRYILRMEQFYNMKYTKSDIFSKLMIQKFKKFRSQLTGLLFIILIFSGSIFFLVIQMLQSNFIVHRKLMCWLYILLCILNLTEKILSANSASLIYHS